MKKIYITLMLVSVSVISFAQTCGKLFFSEYVEGSGNNKAVEIYNPTSVAVSLSGYSIKLFVNGSATPNITLNLNDTIPPAGTYVIAHPLSDDSIKAKADTLSGVTNYNGNDALILLKGVDTLDIIGIIGNDPGAAGWAIGSGSTTDYTLIRNDTVATGTTSWALSITQWSVLAKDTIRLGSHTGPINLTMCGGNAIQDTFVNFSPTAGTFTGVNGNFNLNLQLSLTPAAAHTVEVVLLSGNAAWVNNFQNQTINFAPGSNQQTLTLTITNDTTGGQTHILTFKLANPSGLLIGADSIFTLTLEPPVVQSCGNLFFSEYVEGSSSNKAIEIYNPTPYTVSLLGYSIKLFANGNSNPNTTLNLNKTLPPGGVFVIANPLAGDSIKIKADTLSNVANYNGNDALVLLKGTDTLDIIGIVGNDPGAAGWAVGSGSTTDYTLVRKETIAKGTTNWLLSSNSQWYVLPKDTIRLGSHTGPINIDTCGAIAQDTFVFFSPTSATFSGVNGNFDLNLQLNPTPSANHQVDVELLSGNAALINNFQNQTVNFTAGTNQQTLTLTITNDTTGGQTHLLTFKLTNPVGLSVGADSVFTLTLQPPAEPSCGQLFFSEYIEGSGTNKALEIYNPTNTPVNLSGYKVVLFVNGNPTPNTTFNLSGTLLPGKVYVIANSGSNDSIKIYADTISSVTNFNGNDALALMKGTDTLDIIGIIGNDPGTAGWAVDSGSTTDRTLIRKETISKGTTDWAVGALQWYVLPKDTLRLGAHTGPANTPPCNPTTAIQPVNNNLNVNIYPNPADSRLNIVFNDNAWNVITIYDVSGKAIYTEAIKQKTVSIDVSLWANGIYLVKLENNGTVSRAKLVVKH